MPFWNTHDFNAFFWNTHDFNAFLQNQRNENACFFVNWCVMMADCGPHNTLAEHSGMKWHFQYSGWNQFDANRIKCFGITRFTLINWWALLLLLGMDVHMWLCYERLHSMTFLLTSAWKIDITRIMSKSTLDRMMNMWKGQFQIVNLSSFSWTKMIEIEESNPVYQILIFSFEI